jgi:hypothetical protein
MNARLLFVACALFAAPSARATPPSLVTYSGYLAKSSGAPVTSATTLIFSFYTGATSSTAVWQDTVTVTPTADGWFSAVIGTNTLNPLLPSDFAQDLWLGIRVSTELAEMTPRTELTSTPYALTTDWQNVQGRPATFPPGPHQHAGADVTSAVAAANSVPWSGVNGAPAFITTVSRDGTLIGDGVGTPLGVNGAAVQARIGNSCGAGQYLYGVDVAGAPLCRVDENSGGIVTAISGNPPVTIINGGTSAPTVGLAFGAGLAALAGSLTADFGGNGASTQVSRADHTHPIVVNVPLSAFSVAGGSAIQTATTVGYSLAAWRISPGGSIQGTVTIPASAVGGDVTLRAAVTTSVAGGGSLNLRLQSAGVVAGAPAPQCALPRGTGACWGPSITVGLGTSTVASAVGTSSTTTQFSPTVCSTGVASAAGDVLVITVGICGTAAVSVDVVGVSVQF